MKSKIIIFLTLLISIHFSCKQGSESDGSIDQKADLIIINCNLFTGVDNLDSNDAILIKDGKILDFGKGEAFPNKQDEKTQIIDAKNNFVMPGFIEGHGHFTGLGMSILNLNFLDSKNWNEILAMVADKIENTESGEWIEGRGWHQEKWDELPSEDLNGYPIHDQLSQLSKDNPVILYHASGHSLFANQEAMDLAGVTNETNDPIGGRIVRDESGNAIGVFEERAMYLISAAYNNYLKNQSQDELQAKWVKAIELAQEECLKKGISSFQDAGASFKNIADYKKMAINGELDVRLWTMVRHDSNTMKGRLQDAKVVNAGNNFFTCNAIKTEVDGALGSFGAWLLKPYNDKSDFEGQNTTDVKEVQAIANLALKNDMQLCVHAIGDKANQVVLDIMEAEFEKIKEPKDYRWRIEHAQHLDPEDIPRFKTLNVIASMQAVHCTSDAPFVEKRLGNTRAKEGAYAWRSLIDAGAVVTNGTDAPVEDVDPLRSFYASVTRKRADNQMEFFTEQKMTRLEALKSYTINNAYAAFEEEMKGTLEIGKLADIVILDTDLLNCSDEDILTTKVKYTIVDGQIKFSAKE